MVYGCDELILERESKIINHLCKESLTKGSLTNLRLAQVKKFAKNITINSWENTACLLLMPFGTPVIKEGDGSNIINYIRDVFLTLKLAHSYGVFHRDVSPRNIIVVEELNDYNGKVKRGYLIDWNVAVFENDDRKYSFWFTIVYVKETHICKIAWRNIPI